MENGKTDHHEKEGDTAVVLVEEVRELSKQLDQAKAHLRELESEIRKKDAEVRNMREESVLLRDLNTINELSMRKVAIQSQARPKKIKVDEATVQQILSLEAQIKLEQKNNKELEASQKYTIDAIQRTEEDIQRYNDEIEQVKLKTGFETNEGLQFTNENNLFKEYQKSFSALDEKQELVKRETTCLTSRIEELTKELNIRKSVDEEMVKTQLILEQGHHKLEQLKEDRELYSRINKKKNRLVVAASRKDQRVQIRSLESDKRMLHNELSKISAQRKGNDKTIAAQALHIKQLEVRLNELCGFLGSVFSSKEESHFFLQNVDPNETSVEVAKFDELQRNIAVSRRSLEVRNESLQKLDYLVEVNDKRGIVLHGAMGARMANASQALQSLERDYQLLKSHLDSLQGDFESDCDALNTSNNQLRALLTANQVTPSL